MKNKGQLFFFLSNTFFCFKIISYLPLYHIQGGPNTFINTILLFLYQKIIFIRREKMCSYFPRSYFFPETCRSRKKTKFLGKYQNFFVPYYKHFSFKIIAYHPLNNISRGPNTLINTTWLFLSINFLPLKKFNLKRKFQFEKKVFFFKLELFTVKKVDDEKKVRLC